MHRFLARALTVALFAAVLAAPAVLAQEVAPAAPAPEFEDAELDAFAEAYVGIEELQQQYQIEYGEIEDPEQMQEVQQKFEGDATEIITETGISVERYEQIIMATQADPSLTEDILERVEAVRLEREG